MDILLDSKYKYKKTHAVTHPELFFNISVLKTLKCNSGQVHVNYNALLL